MLHLSQSTFSWPLSIRGLHSPSASGFMVPSPLRQSKQGTCPVYRDFRETPPTYKCRPRQDHPTRFEDRLGEILPSLPDFTYVVKRYSLYTAFFRYFNTSEGSLFFPGKNRLGTLTNVLGWMRPSTGFAVRPARLQRRQEVPHSMPETRL